MRGLDGTSSFHDDDGTVRLRPNDASHTIPEHVEEQLDRYCDTLRVVRFPRHDIVWDTARRDDDVVVIHVFDPTAGIHFRTLQPVAGGGGSWECLDAIKNDKRLGTSPSLMALVMLGASSLLGMHIRSAPAASSLLN